MEHQNEVKVWDLFVRFFHWSLVVLFASAYLTGGEDLPKWLVSMLGMGDEPPLHMWFGYGIATLVVLRVVWGFVGTAHARFADFVFDRATIIGYAKDLLSGSAKRYIGHNPLGGAMVVTLLVSLGLTTLTGMLHYGLDDGKGPLGGFKVREVSVAMPSISLISDAYADSDDEAAGHDHKSHGDEEEEDELLKEIHEFFANFTLFLVFLHLGGVVFESRFHKENLARAMVTGRKRQ